MPTFTVSSLWRYPVKSMVGEEVESIDITSWGLTGDRVYALVDSARGQVGSAKNVRKFGDLVKCEAQFATPPDSSSARPPVRMKLPNGKTLLSNQHDAEAILNEAFGPNVSFVSRAPRGLMLEFPAGTFLGKHVQTTEMPMAGAAPHGSLFDYATIHIVTTSTLRRLQAAYPAGQFSIERFRPNLVLDCADDLGFIENTWIGKVLAIGPDLRVRISMPCPRCVMTTLPRRDLPLDPGILKTIAQKNSVDLGDFGHLPCAGVYADVKSPGRVTKNQEVHFSD